MRVFLFCISLLLSADSVRAQSFEQMHFPGITTSVSSSRSANFIDVNNDGWDDIFFSNGLSSGEKNMLYINNGDGTFTTVTDDDIVEQAIRAVGASFADVDNDGDMDGFVVTWGSGGLPRRNYFYRNNGNGTFTFEPGVAPNLTYSETATWIDVNNDQLLDLYITNSAGLLRNLYFENQGDGTFLERNDLAITNESKPSRSVDWVDYDNDGDPDLFVTNEGNNKNTLYRNDGANSFTQITDLAIVQQNRNSMGSSWADVDNDGDFDLVVMNYEQANQLFINENGLFTEITGSEIAAEITNSFGSTFGDVDNDGDLDLLVLNSYSDTHFTNSLFINDGKGNFTKNTSDPLAQYTGWTYSAAFGDYNNDGWLDVILANNRNESQANAVFKNTGTGNNWIRIKCAGTHSNKSAIGAIVKVTAVISGDTITQTRKIEASSGYASQNSLTAHFGLGNARDILRVQIRWPAGLVETFDGLAVNSSYILTEGTGTTAATGIKSSGFKVYPNPANNQLFIEAPLHMDYKISLINSQGKQVKSQVINHKATLDIAELPPGAYLYRITENNTVLSSGKVIKN